MACEFGNHPTALIIYLAALLGEAVCDFSVSGEPLPVDLHRRFVGWRHPVSEAYASRDGQGGISGW